MSTPILRLRDQNGNVVDVLALIGPKGDKGEPGVGAGNITLADVTDGNGKTLGVIIDELWQSDASTTNRINAVVEANGYLGALPNGTDVSTLTTNGWYMIDPSYTYANLPAERTNWGVLEVRDKTAVLWELNTGRVFYSYLISMNQTPWAELYSTANPLTTDEVGALPAKPVYITDANAELTGNGTVSIKRYTAATANTPFAAGLTAYAEGTIITYSQSSAFVTQICIPEGQRNLFVRQVSGSAISPWGRVPVVHQSTAPPTQADGFDGDVWHQYVV